MSLRFADIRFASGKSVKLKLILLRLGNMQILRKLYIQVSASILDEHTRERELSPLLNARDLSAKRMVLTLDRFGLGKSDGVTVANAIDWMLGK